MSLNKIVTLAAITGLLVFFICTYLVKINLFNSFDYQATLNLQNSLGHIWDLPFSLFSIIGSFEVTSLIWGVIFLVILSKRYFRTAISLFLFFAGLLTELLGKLDIVHRQPPAQLHRGVIDLPLPSGLITENITNNSYPSGHIFRTTFIVAFLFFWILTSSIKYKRLIEVGLINFLVVMIISRIYLGEHWLSDVIGGFMLGLSLGSLTALTLPKIGHTKLTPKSSLD